MGFDMLRLDFLAHSFAEAGDSPFRGVVQNQTGVKVDGKDSHFGKQILLAEIASRLE